MQTLKTTKLSTQIITEYDIIDSISKDSEKIVTSKGIYNELSANYAKKVSDEIEEKSGLQTLDYISLKDQEAGFIRHMCISAGTWQQISENTMPENVAMATFSEGVKTESLNTTL